MENTKTAKMTLPPILVVNRPERTDRRDYISAHLAGHGLPFEIIPATNPFTTANGFLNLATRGAFLSHMTLWDRIAKENKPYLILEDDANIPASSLPLMIARYEAVQRCHFWHCLYFYSNPVPGIVRVCEGSTCGYILNPALAPISVAALRSRYESLLVSGPKNWMTHIDQWLAKDLWKRHDFFCYGSEELVFRVDMGSDTGWKEHRVEK